MRISAAGRGWVYSVFGFLFLSGALWFALDRFVIVVGEFGAEKHPLEAWSLRAHGVAAAVGLVVLGWLLPHHVRGGWRSGLNRRSGATTLGANALLAASGVALYYLGDEVGRSAASWFHLGLGGLLPAILVVHVLRGRRARRRRDGERRERAERRD